jgi:hypothetical protein
MLASTSQLYLDYVLIRSDMPKLEKLSRRARRVEPFEAYIDRASINRETVLRRQFRKQLESLNCWSYFEPDNAFSEHTGLHTLQDYINNFALHLPEIYEETFRVEKCARNFRENQNDSDLADLIIGLEHLGRHHISFAHLALEWAADESSWRD